jgi:hypothetical protein
MAKSSVSTPTSWPAASPSELRAETLQMGYSLRRLLHELDDFLVPPAFDALAGGFLSGWLGAGGRRSGKSRSPIR